MIECRMWKKNSFSLFWHSVLINCTKCWHRFGWSNIECRKENIFYHFDIMFFDQLQYLPVYKQLIEYTLSKFNILSKNAVNIEIREMSLDILLHFWTKRQNMSTNCKNPFDVFLTKCFLTSRTCSDVLAKAKVTMKIENLVSKYYYYFFFKYPVIYL